MRPAHHSSGLRRSYTTVAILFTLASIPAPYLLVFAVVLWQQAGLLNRRHHLDQRFVTLRAAQLAYDRERRREDELIRLARSLR